jgi:hypothetical protein
MSSSVHALAINRADEQRLRELASGVAKDIEDVNELLKRMGFSRDEYEELCETRVFKVMLEEAYSEWSGANNTPKRVKLKAAINIELSLPSFYKAMTDMKEPLSSRVKAFEIMARIGGLGNPEPVLAGGGNSFNLTIQLDGSGSKPPREIVINGSAIPALPSNTLEGNSVSYSQSPLLDALPFEEF